MRAGVESQKNCLNRAMDEVRNNGAVSASSSSSGGVIVGLVPSPAYDGRSSSSRQALVERERHEGIIGFNQPFPYRLRAVDVDAAPPLRV